MENENQTQREQTKPSEDLGTVEPNYCASADVEQRDKTVINEKSEEQGNPQKKTGVAVGVSLLAPISEDFKGCGKEFMSHGIPIKCGKFYNELREEFELCPRCQKKKEELLILEI